MSRFITYPSKVNKEQDPFVIIVSPTKEDIEKTERFLQTSSIDFDVFLVDDEQNDKEWLDYLFDHSDHVLINSSSSIRLNVDATNFDSNLIENLEKIEQKNVDK